MMIFMALMWAAVMYNNRKEASRALGSSQEDIPKDVQNV